MIPDGYKQVKRGYIRRDDMWWNDKSNAWFPMGYSVGNDMSDPEYKRLTIIRPIKPVIRHYTVRLTSGWFALAANSLEACVKDIPNHNPDGEILEVRQISKELFDEYEKGEHFDSPEEMLARMKYPPKQITTRQCAFY